MFEQKMKEVLELIESEKFDEAIKQLNQIVVDSDLSSADLAKVYFFQGFAFQLQGQLDKAIEVLSQITPEDNAKAYAQAQFNIGLAYQKQSKLDKAVDAWSQITREDDAKKYAQAQLSIGIVYQEQSKLDQAVDAWNQITREDDIKVYVQAQLSIGIVYQEQSKLDQAVDTWSQVTREDDAKAYAQAQFNIGLAYQQQSKLDQAVNVWNQVTREDDAKAYAQAQVNIGSVHQKQSELDQAVDAWSQITQKDDADAYAKAQFNIGFVYQEQGKLEKALELWSQINQEDDADAYAKAQFNIGNVYQEQGKLDKAIAVWEKINQSDHEVVYIRVQKILISKLEKETLTKKTCKSLINYLKNIKDICDENKAILENKYKIYTSNITLENKKNLIHILEKVENILKALWVQPTDEKAIAHYTNLTVSKILLGVNEKKITSSFRLNTIQLMNDPKEGELLYPLINLKKQKEPKDIAFISCFTLHHDSLNQFRLYGKEAEKEASGVSLVLSQQFFASKHDTASIYCDVSKQELMKIDQAVSKDGKKAEQKNNLEPLPLYRCIYLDPKSELVKVAQREEWSFYREHVKADQTEKKFTREKNKAKNEYKKYLKKISIVEENIESLLNNLKGEINSINKQNEFTEQQLLADILLPLRFLIKHIAFKEEQECRVLYVTQSENNIIQYDGKIDRLYIDYKPYVLEHLEKIYLAPRATNQKEIYEHLCINGRKNLKIKKDNDVRVKISQHPFR